MTAVIADTFPSSPLPGILPAVDVEFSPTTLPLEGPQWRSFGTDLRSWSTKRGRSRELDRPAAGKHKAKVGNIERAYDPSNDSSPHAGGILAQKRCRAVARDADGNGYPLAVGFIDGWPQEFKGPRDAWVDVSYTDIFKLLARADLPRSMYDLAVSIDRPAHWWKLHETSGAIAADSGFAGTLYAGTYVGAPTLGVDALIDFDDAGTCATFAAASHQHIEVPAGVTAFTDTYTVEVWLKVAAPPASTQYIADAGNTVKLTFRINTDGHVAVGINENSGFSICDGLVHHVVYTSQGDFRGLYVDGVLVDSAAGNGPQISTGFVIGNNLVGTVPGTNWLTATLSHFALYYDALSAARVLDHYNAGKTAFAGTDTGTQVGRVLDYLRIPAADRNIRTGSSTIGAYALPGGTALSYILKLDETERGLCFVDALGRFTWIPRHALLTDVVSTTVQAIFGNDGVNLPFTDIVFGFDEVDVIDDVTVTRQGGIPQHVFDVATIETQTLQSEEVSGVLYASDLVANDAARWILDHNKTPALRVEALTIDLRANPALIPIILRLDIGHRVAVSITPGSTGTPLAVELYVLGIAHDSPPKKWTVTLETGLADPLDYWIFDAALFDADTRFAF